MAYDPKQILLAVQSLRPGAEVMVDFDIVDMHDGNGPFIAAWRRDDVAAPTKEEIQAVDTDALLKARVSFFSRDLLARLTADDYATIMKAIESRPALGLLWSSLLAQGESPISVSSDRFQQGWAGLAEVLGVDRANAIAISVGIPGK